VTLCSTRICVKTANSKVSARTTVVVKGSRPLDGDAAGSNGTRDGGESPGGDLLRARVVRRGGPSKRMSLFKRFSIFEAAGRLLLCSRGPQFLDEGSRSGSTVPEIDGRASTKKKIWGSRRNSLSDSIGHRARARSHKSRCRPRLVSVCSRVLCSRRLPRSFILRRRRRRACHVHVPKQNKNVAFDAFLTALASIDDVVVRVFG